MDGVHDMGGMDGFGKVEPEQNEPVFHQRWEGRVLAMSRAISALRLWTIDMSRYSIELLSPAIYLSASYYERWFLRNVSLLAKDGMLAPYVLISAADAGIAQDYAAYRAAHRDVLHAYVERYVVRKKERGK